MGFSTVLTDVDSARSSISWFWSSGCLTCKIMQLTLSLEVLKIAIYSALVQNVHTTSALHSSFLSSLQRMFDGFPKFYILLIIVKLLNRIYIFVDDFFWHNKKNKKNLLLILLHIYCSSCRGLVLKNTVVYIRII